MSKSKFQEGDKVQLTKNSRSWLNLKKGAEGIVIGAYYMRALKRTCYYVLFKHHSAPVYLWHYSGLVKTKD